MAMPADLVLVRHGESEGNLANHHSKRGDDSLWTPEFRARTNREWRLTDRGIEQAQTAGEWIAENIGTDFFRYYTSEFIRAKETAAYLGLPDAVWFQEFYLRERDWGALDRMPQGERRKKFAKALAARQQDSFYWRPPNGESMAELCLRVDRVLDTLHRECPGEKVIIVCHGEVMWAFRVRLERMTQERWHQLDWSRDPLERIHNCQVLHYSRRDPKTGEVGKLAWLRSVCPSDTSLSTNDWQTIERQSFTNADLLAMAEQVPRMLEA